MARKVIGPTGSRRRRWLFLCATLAALGTTAFVISGAGAFVTGSPSHFESNDGNMTVTTSGQADWNCFANGNSTGFASGVTVGGTCPTGANALNYSDASASPADPAGEIQLVSGSKFDDLCPGLNVGNNPPKDEFQATAEYSDTNSSTHDTYFYGASIRPTTNGNSTGNLELNQVAGNGTTTHGCRTAGDRLIAFDFLNGGTTLQFHVLTYITPTNTTAGGNTGSCYSGKSVNPPCWGAKVITPDSSQFEGEVNTGLNGVTGAIDAAHNGISGTAINAFAFNEMGVNLTQVLGLSGQCFSFPQQVWETRSSGSSFTSNPQDLEFQSITIKSCGEIKIIKQSDPRGQNQSFSFTSGSSQLPASSTAGGVICSGNTTAGVQSDGIFCLNDTGNTGKTPGSTLAADNSTGNTIDEQGVPQGTYTVTEGTEPNGYSFANLSCGVSGTGGSTAPTSGETATINLKPGDTVTCLYKNHLNTSSLSTQASSNGSVTPGTGVYDTATATGDSVSGNTPSGSVTFYLCGPLTTASGCTSSGTKLTPDGTLGNGSGITATATSPTVNSSTTLAPGIYCFAAYWGGDNSYPGGNSTTATNECFTVAKIDTSTVTTPNDGTHLSTAETSITLGSTIYDTAVVTGTSAGGDPGGFVVFHECGPISTGNCSINGTLLGSSTGVALVSDGLSTTYTSSATSAGFSPTATGRYCFRGDYLGSSVYNSSSDPPNTTLTNECFTVTDTTTSSSTQSWYPNDSASVSADHGAKLNGTLSLQLYSNADCGKSESGGGAVNNSAVNAANNFTTLTNVLSGTVSTSNTSYHVDVSGSYSWLATFSSTDSNVGNSTHCETATLTINNNPTQ